MRIEEMVSVSDQVLKLIKNGIADGDKVRKFNLFDYYKIVQISPKKLYAATAGYLRAKYGEDDVRHFYSFVSANGNEDKLDEKKIFEMGHQFMMGDKTIDVTADMKMDVIQYLKDNNLPYTNKFYFVTLREYVNGRVDLDVPFDEISTRRSKTTAKVRKRMTVREK